MSDDQPLKPRGYPTHRLEPGYMEWLEEQLEREERERKTEDKRREES